MKAYKLSVGYFDVLFPKASQAFKCAETLGEAFTGDNNWKLNKYVSRPLKWSITEVEVITQEEADFLEAEYDLKEAEKNKE